MTNYHLPQHEWAPLRDLLAQIPGVLQDLAITMSRQDRIGTGLGISNGDSSQPLPINLGATDAADDLRGELLIWVRHTARDRALPAPERTDTLTLARWLYRHLVDLAQAPEADLAHDRIERCIRNCRRACDRPAEQDTTVNPEAEARAHNLELNARACVTIIKTLGPTYPGVTQRKIKYLKESGKVIPLRLERAGKDTWWVYRLGDILDATRVTEQQQETA